MKFELARRNMVESQIRPNKVTDERVIEAISAVQRERFVPAALRGVSYIDEDVPIGNGRYLMEPMVFARLLQDAGVRSDDIVLEIGCGTGYVTAVLARLAEMVVAVESDGDLATRATATLSELAVDNAVVLPGSLAAGAAQQSPYDLIFVSGAIQHVPAAILNQLAEGGRLVAVVESGGVGRAIRMEKSGGVVSRQALFDASVPRLPGFEEEPRFVF
jgi:protein-L-isoaspartate(D-aspartate) O-methyltransferase